MIGSDNYFKGYFNNEESMLYYRSDFLTIPGFSKMPTTQLNFKNIKELGGQTKITFRIVIPVFLIFAIGIILLWILYIFNVDGLRTSDGGIIIPILGSIFFYGIPFVKFRIELSYFKTELEKLELTST